MSWNSVEIDVIAYSDEAKKRIEELDLSSFGLEEELSYVDGRFHCELEEIDYFDDDLDDEFKARFC